MDMPKVEVKTFVELRKTDTSSFFANLVKDSIKIIGKELDVYYYDRNKALYESSMADYFNDISKTLLRCFRKFTQDEDIDEEEIMRLRKAVIKNKTI